MPALSIIRYAPTDNEFWYGCKKRKLIALIGVGRWNSRGRERRRDLDDKENEASQSTGGQQERGLMERAKVWAKVGPQLRYRNSWLRYADQLAESTRASPITQRSKATERISVKKPLLVPVPFANHRSPKRKILNRNFAAQKQRRPKRRLHDEA